MGQTVAFVEEPGRVVIDRKRKLATITYSSGGDTFVRKMAIEDFRAFIEDGTRCLNEYDSAERQRVVPFKKRPAGH